MALTIEDGSIVANADSYATLAEARAYAASRGLSLSSDDSVLEPLMRQAVDYLATLEDRFKGERVSSSQELAWPRQYVYVYGQAAPLANDSIPNLLKQVQSQLAFDCSQADLLPTGSGQETIREKVDVLEVQYAEQGTTAIIPVPTKALAMLAPLLKNGGGGQGYVTRV